MAESKSSPRRIEANHRQLRALELRKAGDSFQVIADKLGYAHRACSYKAVMAALRKTLQEPADELRQIEVERLDAMLVGLWPRARRGNAQAVDRVLRIMQRRAKLLGLDAPTRTDITSKDKAIKGYAIFNPADWPHADDQEAEGD